MIAYLQFHLSYEHAVLMRQPSSFILRMRMIGDREVSLHIFRYI